MSEFTGRDLSNTRFQRTNFTGADIRDADFSGAWFRDAEFVGAVMRGVVLADMEIDGEIGRLVINGVEVGPLIQAELERRDPQYAKMRPVTADGYREAWDIIERRWADTVARARDLPPDLLHASVDDEWSFIQTLRHLVFATDAWVRRALHGDPAPWHPLGLPWNSAPEWPEIPRDLSARPSLDEVLELRKDRMATVREVVDRLTDEDLAGHTTPVEGPGWPPAESFPVGEVLRTVLNEEWHHRRFAERDLAKLTA